MIRTPPSFMSDWGRFSLAVAIRKRWGSFPLATTSYKYAQILKMDWNTAMAVLVAAAPYSASMCGFWAFESLCITARGDFRGLWQHVMAALGSQPDTLAVAMLKRLIGAYLTSAQLDAVPLDARGDYLLGKAYAELAFAAKGSNKAALQNNKKQALRYLGQAREKCHAQQQQPGADPYRQAAFVAALAAAVATAYEGVAYLQYKGTRTAALAE